MEEKLREYAELLIKVGLDLRPGQTLLISSPIECVAFARLCASAAYAAGCREVVFDWYDDRIERERFIYADDAAFDSYPVWRAALMNETAAAGAASLTISARDPEVFKGVDEKRVMRSRTARFRAITPFYDAVLKNKVQWCVVSVPIPKWAKKVFPELPEREAMSMLWDAIFSAMRVTGDGGAVERWQKHLDTLETRQKKLNSLRLKSLHYTDPRGTDLTVELPEGHRWQAGRNVTATNRTFTPNMPVEAIFTAPLRTGVNGVVLSSLPFTLNGNIVDRIQLVLKDGKIAEAYAEKGRDALKAALAADENASYFGEVTLVPFGSPISKQGLSFYNPLFDENMRCSISAGSANPECLEGGEDMSDEELVSRGLNRSSARTCLIIGTAELSVVGTTGDGKEVPIITDGNFAL